MFGQIYLETIQAWHTLQNPETRDARARAVSQLCTAYNAHDHIKHRIGYHFVRATGKEYVVVRDDYTGEEEYNTFPATHDGLRMAIFTATSLAMREILQ